MLIVVPFVFGTTTGQAQTMSAEEYAVYSTLLNQIRNEDQETYLNARDIVLVSRTLIRQDIVDSFDSRNRKSLLDDFKKVNKTSVGLGDLPLEHYHLIDEIEVRGLFAKGEALYKQALANKRPNEIILGTEYWIPFYQKYSEAVGLYKISRVGFDRKKLLALANLTFESNLAGFSRMYVLKKTKGTWTVIERSGEESIS